MSIANKLNELVSVLTGSDSRASGSISVELDELVRAFLDGDVSFPEAAFLRIYCSRIYESGVYKLIAGISYNDLVRDYSKGIMPVLVWHDSDDANSVAHFAYLSEISETPENLAILIFEDGGHTYALFNDMSEDFNKHMVFSITEK